MITLLIDNSSCRLLNLPFEVWKDLRELLSYNLNSRATYFSSARSSKRYLMDKKGGFPSGLLHTVREHLKKKGIKYDIRDLRTRPKANKRLFSMSLGYPLYPEQTEAVNACIAAAEGRGAISAVTGFGKSITMIALVHALQLKTLIIVPRLELKKQLTESFQNAFGSLDNITIENIDSRSLKTAADYDVLIIDEAHHTAAKTYRDLNKKAWTGIYHRFFFTATPFRSRDEEQLLYESIAGQVIYRVDYKTAVDKGYIVPVEAYYVELPKVEIKGNELSWPAMYSELVVNREDRNLIIAEMLAKVHFTGASTLCLVKEVKHGENITALTGGAFAHGMDDDTPRLINSFSNGELKTLVGTTGVCGEGVDTRAAEYIIIAGLGKSKNSLMQQIGRGVRRYKDKESCKVILFLDRSHKWSLQHFKAQCKVLLEEYGVKPIKLEVK